MSRKKKEAPTTAEPENKDQNVIDPNVQAAEEQMKLTTSQRLFPEKFPVNQNNENEEGSNQEGGQENAQVEGASGENVQPKQIDEKGGDEFDFDAYQDRKVIIKSDGVEEEVTLGELRKRHQSNKTIGKRFEQLARMQENIDSQRRELESVITDLKTRKTAQNTEPTSDEYISQDPAYQAMMKKNEELEGKITALTKTFEPVARKSAESNVVDALKSEGFEDADQFRDKIMTHLSTLSQENMDLALQKAKEADTPQGAIQLFKDIKLKELMSGQNTPKKEVKEPRKVPIQKIDSGTGPASTAQVDDRAEKKRQAFEHAKKTGDWSPFLKITGYGG